MRSRTLAFLATWGAVAMLLLAACAVEAVDRVYGSPDAVQPLAPGSRVPSVQVATVRGEPIDLAKQVRDQGALMVFYRGGWWPYCNTQLGELRKVEPELSELGFPIIAISADRPSALLASRAKHNLGYSLYSDGSLAAARAFGIVYQLDDAEVARYAQHGIDLEAASGHSHHQLPVPSVFLIEAGGAIRWVYSNPDYKLRPDNASLLDAARKLANRSSD